MPDALPGALRLHLPTDLVFVRPARKMIEGLLAGQNWPKEAVEEVVLVATELVQNAIEHGSKGDGTEEAEVHLVIDETSVTVEVWDPGTGKDPQILLERDVTKPVPLDEPRGRGLFLINRLASSLERGRRPDPESGCSVRVRMECSS